MGPFPSSFSNKYILVAVNYVSKWVEVVALPMNDAGAVMKFVSKNIFTRFGTPRAIISDGGSHFCNKEFSTMLKKFGVTHKIATPYHPQTSGQLSESFEPTIKEYPRENSAISTDHMVPKIG